MFDITSLGGALTRSQRSHAPPNREVAKTLPPLVTAETLWVLPTKHRRGTLKSTTHYIYDQFGKQRYMQFKGMMYTEP